MPEAIYIALIPLLPLAGFLLIALAGRRLLPKYCGLLGTLTLLASFALSLLVAWLYFYGEGKSEGGYEQIVALKLTWLQFAPGLSIDMGILLDPISVMMIVVITFISLMVHIYSLGYMHHEPRIATYFSFLSLFTFSMLGLVLSSNIFQIYIFWELVGVSSFLLIGFYYNKPAAVAASKKAFIVTRFADLGFLVGILILSFYTETLDFQTLIARATDPAYVTGFAGITFMGLSVLTWGLTLVFIGGAGKSAMFPLHIWLPDAMEGPTPVSALIHAATMVVAGVYLVARLFPVFAISCPAALDVVGYVGAFSALFAALIACTQTDIKRVLAYSTISQIGFMMFALGVSGYGGEAGLGYAASMFHLFTHAIFKALLFLGAGAVIHFVHSNEVTDMGGLRKTMPLTHLSFLVACLAIAGVPPLSGFFSKEEILLAAWQSNKVIFYTAILTTGLTAFYMFRLYFLIFWNRKPSLLRAKGKQEAPFSMLFTLALLGLLSIGAGFVPFGKFVSSDGLPLSVHPPVIFSAGPVLLALSGIMLAYILYRRESPLPGKLSRGLGKVYRAAWQKFYIDEIWLFITKKIIFNAIGRPAAWIDRTIVDGAVNGTATVTAFFSRATRKIQSGKLQDYSIYFLTGTTGFVLILVYLMSNNKMP
jgi:NADH-quinone oxidoreductase subunit L